MNQNSHSENEDYDLYDDEVDSEDQAALAENEGGESDPLASEEERRRSAVAEPEPDHSENADALDEEDVFGPSIDDLLQESRSRSRKRRRKMTSSAHSRPRTRVFDVPHHLKSVMGSANLAFVSKEYDKAVELISKIIEEAPRSSQPYRTLGLVHEARGDRDQALDVYMKAAEIEKTDRELWKRNAAVWKEKGEISKAIHCLSQALRGTNCGDPEALRARAQLYAENGRPVMAADSFVKLSKLDPFNVESVRLIAQCYIEGNNLRRAADSVDVVVTECERQIASAPKQSSDREIALIDIVELITELKLRQKRFADANLFLVRLRGRCAVANRPLTFKQRLMLAICQHRLGSDVLAAPVFQEFMSSTTLMEKHRFLLWHVADACHDSGHYHMAVSAYSSLIEMEDEEPRVDKYLRRAICYKELGFREGAKSDLETVLSIQPRHVVASLHMQEFLPKPDKKRRRSSRLYSGARVTSREKEEATEVLRVANNMFETGDFEGYLLHVYAALDTALELRAPWRAKTVLKRHNDNSEDFDDAEYGDSDSGSDRNITKEAKPPPTKRRRTRRWTGARRSPLDKVKLQRIGATLMRTMGQDTYLQVAERVMLSFRAVGELELAHPVTRIFNSLSHLRLFGKEDKRRKLRNLDLVTSVADGSVWRGYDQARHLLHEDPTDTDLLYVFTLVEHLCEWEVHASELRNKSYRGLARLRTKYPKSACLALVLANISSRGGLNVQRYTVGFYLAALSLVQDNALVCLCLAVQVLYVMMGRRIRNRNEVFPHVLAYLQNYERNRLKDVEEGMDAVHRMEVDYNKGRLMHQAGLIDVACNLYERVLHNGKAEELDEVPEWADLRRDAAFNLVQIYRKSGAVELASKLSNDFLTF